MERGLNRRYICLLQLLGKVSTDDCEIYMFVDRITDGGIILICFYVLVNGYLVMWWPAILCLSSEGLV